MAQCAQNTLEIRNQTTTFVMLSHLLVNQFWKSSRAQYSEAWNCKLRYLILSREVMKEDAYVCHSKKKVGCTAANPQRMATWYTGIKPQALTELRIAVSIKESSGLHLYYLAMN